jgi:hypothetical protein
MAIYSTLYGLPQSMVDYLNQPLPDISGIFQPSEPSISTPVSVEDVITEEGIASLYPQVATSGGGGDSFSPYNIRPGDSSIRTFDQYNPYAYRTLTGIEQLLPVNRGAIFQNELLGGGFKLDNIGRIVTDNYNTPEGIMAGYNPVSGGLLNMLTGGAYGEPTTYGLDKSYDKRRETVAKALEKMGMSKEDIEAALAGEYTGEAPINPITGKPTTLVDTLGLFNQSQNLLNKRLSMADLIFEKKLEEKQQKKQAEIDAINERKRRETDAAKQRELQIQAAAKAQDISRRQAREQQAAIERDQQRDRDRGGAGSGGGGVSASGAGSGGGYNQGNFCFDPNTPIQMADGSEKKIKDIQLGDDTKGGEVTGVFQFKATDEIHDYKGVTVAGSHYVKEDGKFIMVKDSLLSVKIDKIPVVYSLDTTGRRIFINNIEFADYNGDGIAKGFLENAGVDLAGFDKEVLRQVEHRLI